MKYFLAHKVLVHKTYIIHDNLNATTLQVFLNLCKYECLQALTLQVRSQIL